VVPELGPRSAQRLRPRARWFFGLVVLVVVFVLVPIASARIVYQAWSYAADSLHPDRVPVYRPASAPAEMESFSVLHAGVTIRGWYIPPRNGAVIVFGHGHGANRLQQWPEAEYLAQHGYGAALFDWPVHGESSGEQVTWGEQEQGVVHTVLDLLARRPEVERVGALGFSMGGLAMALAAEHDPRIGALVLESTFYSLEVMLRHDTRRYGWLSASAARLAMKRAGVHEEAVRPGEHLCELKSCPLLILYGGDDPYVTPKIERQLYAAACEPKQLWRVPRAKHGEFHRVAGEHYLERLLAFFDASLTRPTLPLHVARQPSADGAVLAH
jgi:alpha-beta hydrolase superfamily lysophospholipase